MSPLPSSRTFAAQLSLAVLALLDGLVAQLASAQPPPLMRWQRTLDDALALARLKNLPLLVVANQDGELACDSLVRNRYRDKTFAGLANRYVAVIGSADRHNKQDYDERGRRIPCPRFGCVTCGEHIAIEPELYSRYFKGERVAPRHIGIGTDGKERFDRYLDTGLHKIDESLREHAGQKTAVPSLSSSSQSLAGLAKSHSHIDRVSLETRFTAARQVDRLKILSVAHKSGVRHPSLLRLGLLAEQDTVVRAAEEVLAKTATKADLDLLLRTLGTAGSEESYVRCMQGLERAAKTDDICRRALTIRRALSEQSSRIDPEWWRKLYQEHQGISTTSDLVPDEELEDLDARIEQNTKRARKADLKGKHSLAIARDTLRYALNRIQNSKDPTFLLQDAKGAIERAEKNGAPVAASSVLRTRVHWLLNELDEAGKAADLAIKNADKTQSLLHLEPTSQQTAAILEIYARCQMRIVQSPNLAAEYPAAALTEAHRAWQALAAHPLCVETQHKAHHDLLLYVGARRIAGQTLRQAIKRLPTASLLHEAFREQVLWEGGWPGLSAAYRTIPRSQASNSAIEWFQGYASLLAAEGYVRHAVDKDPDVVYRSAIEAFQRCADSNPDYQRSADHYAAICCGGRAKLALDKGAHATAVDALLDGVKLSPATYPVTDGLQNTMKRTTRRLRRRIAKDASLLEKLDRGLRAAGIDPDL
ncbi:MAG: hypothetical protein VX951_13520 [Planctomycetota bacterium]|nr:hypothetical protein [Planctomycetota bacterium]